MSTINRNWSEDKLFFSLFFCSHCMHRNLTEDMEMHKMLIVKEQEELEERKKIIELKEVCVCVFVCV